MIQKENNQLCLYPSSDLEQGVRASASIWPSFSYLVSGTFLLKIKPHDQYVTKVGTKAVQEGPSAGLGSGAAATPWDGQTDFGCWPPHCPHSCHPHHIRIFSLWTMKVLTMSQKWLTDKKEDICHAVQQRFALGLVLLPTAKDLDEGRQSV